MIVIGIHLEYVGFAMQASIQLPVNSLNLYCYLRLLLTNNWLT